MLGGGNMAAKTANVTARIQPDIKEQAEIILEKLGIPVSVFIDMAYRQIIINGGIPFDLNISKVPEARDAISEDRFNQIMDNGLRQAKNNESLTLADAVAKLKLEIK